MDLVVAILLLSRSGSSDDDVGFEANREQNELTVTKYNYDFRSELCLYTIANFTHCHILMNFVGKGHGF